MRLIFLEIIDFVYMYTILHLYIVFLKFQSFMHFSNNNKNDGKKLLGIKTLRGRQHNYKNSTLSAKMDRALSNSHILFTIEKLI